MLETQIKELSLNFSMVYRWDTAVQSCTQGLTEALPALFLSLSVTNNEFGFMATSSIREISELASKPMLRRKAPPS